MAGAEGRGGEGDPLAVIVGAGFAGINAAHALRDAPVDVLLVDKHNFHTFQPLLYQVGTGYLAVEEVGTSVRQVFRRQANVRVQRAEVVAADLNERTLRLDDGRQIRYDFLVVACGAETTYLGVPGMDRNSWPLYTLDDAIALRMHLLDILEDAAARPGGPDERIATTVVVGGGPTGVETAGALASMAQEILGPSVGLRVVLVEAGPRLLAGFEAASSARALADLLRRGVDVRLGVPVELADAEGVTLAGGERLASRTVVWAAGVRANRLAGVLGLETDRMGRVVCDDRLAVAGRRGVFAVGDVASVFDARLDGPVPMLAPAAIQMGQHAGRQIELLVQGRPLEPFRYRDKGMMAVLGRGDAVAELPLWRGGGRRRLTFGGLSAWLLWLAVHIVYLIGFRHRLKVLIDWGWSYFTSRGAGAILLPQPTRHPERSEAPDPRATGADDGAERPPVGPST